VTEKSPEEDIHRPACVGPNAVTRLAEALLARTDQATTSAVFFAAGAQHLLVHPPAKMVDEIIVRQLYRALFERLPEQEASLIAHDAGERTAHYLLANRIPAPARLILRMLPARLSLRLLLRAIRHHAWTFAGSGQFQARPGRRACVSISHNPMPMPGCVWQVAVFETLFRSLVSRSCQVRHVQCEQVAGPRCEFEIRLH